MPRTLPWLVGASAPSTPTSRSRKRARGSGDVSSSPASLPAAPRTSLASGLLSPIPSSDGPTPVAEPPNAPKHVQRRQRTPSTSPPPVEAPQREYMRPGLGADDIYVMVEDEFVRVAASFTAHLHHAEYMRQRRRARERRARDALAHGAAVLDRADAADAAGCLARGKRRGEKSVGARKRGGKGKEISWESGQSSGEEVEVVGSTKRRRVARAMSSAGVFGLMDSPGKAGASLVGLQGPIVNTRAAAGHGRAQTTPSRSQQYDAVEGVGKGRQSQMSADEETETDSETDSEIDLDATPTQKRYRHGLPKYPYLQADANGKKTAHGRDGPSSESATIKDRHEKRMAVSSSNEDDEDMVAFDGFLRPTPLVKSKERKARQRLQGEGERQAQQHKREHDSLSVSTSLI